MNIDKLEEIIIDQASSFVAKALGVQREVDMQRYMRHKQAVVISGLRRCGKSTLLRQLAEHYTEYYYANFDDERFVNFTVEDFADLMLVFKKQAKANILFFDEIQNIPQWERFVRRVHDEGYKIYLTGSNANLLSLELGTHLTGRYSKIELYPFSYREYLNYYQITWDKITTNKKAELLKVFDEYLVNGGLPEYLNYGDKEFIARTYDDILFRDIVARFGIRDVKALQRLSHYLFTNVCGDLNYNNLKKILNFNNPLSVSTYIGHLEHAYLVFELFKYDYSLKRQHTHTKKSYVIDNGMRNTIAFRFSNDKGKLLENLIYIELKRRALHVYLYKEKNECDFLIQEKQIITQAIQVCYQLTPENTEREIAGLTAAMENFNLSAGLLLTYNQSKQIDLSNDKKIHVVPVWKWLIGGHPKVGAVYLGLC